tara:strand:+ start:53 stop:586 length:534 start_codon:yes stop_codon:yes gene_type:complete
MTGIITDNIGRSSGVKKVVSAAAGGKLLQVLQVVKLDTFSTTTALGSFTDITGMTLAITPAATSSKILVTAAGMFSNGASGLHCGFNLVRESTSIFIGDARSSSQRVSAGGWNETADDPGSFSITYLDSPSADSEITYKLQMGSDAAGGTATFGGSYNGGSSTLAAPGTITLMEIGA